MTITKRCFVRLISFSAALILVLSAAVISSRRNESVLRLKIENSMLKTVDELSSELEELKTTIIKEMYASSPEMTSNLSSKLSSKAKDAKMLMSELPLYELHLENTYKFLSQVGNYCSSLAKKSAQGESISDSDRENLKKLKEYADGLSEHIWNARRKIADGRITISDISASVYSMGDTDKPEEFSDGFTDIEDNYEGYPKLIYDGPFSDHIMEKQPEMLKDKKLVSVEEALKTAKTACGKENLMHTDITDEKGKMPSYVFSANNVNVSVTKQGGYLCYMLGHRNVASSECTAHECITAAKTFLEKLGYSGLIDTYYEISNNECTINFAAKNSDVIFYTDLIKVTVAMDNCDILACDMRGYLTNHHIRTDISPIIKASDAAQNISSLLSARKTTLCVIPTDGKNEKLCYEINCTDESGQNVLVYINADTGIEEEILLLNITENGTLTI